MMVGASNNLALKAFAAKAPNSACGIGIDKYELFIYGK